MKLGFCRTVAKLADIFAEAEALERFGCDRVLIYNGSLRRSELDVVARSLVAGDEFVVANFHCVADTLGLSDFIANLTIRDIRFQFLAHPFDTGTTH